MGRRLQLPPRPALDAEPGHSGASATSSTRRRSPRRRCRPLLPDANRNGFTIGYGTGRPELDLALMYLLFDERTRDAELRGRGSTFFGTYNTTAILLGATVNF